MKNIIIFNILKLIDWICNILFAWISTMIFIYIFFWWGGLDNIKPIFYILLCISVIWIIIIPDEEQLKKILNLNK